MNLCKRPQTAGATKTLDCLNKLEYSRLMDRYSACRDSFKGKETMVHHDEY